MGKRALAAAGALVLLVCLALPVAGDEEGATDDAGGKPAGKGLREEVDVETRREEAIAKLEKPLEKMRVKVFSPHPLTPTRSVSAWELSGKGLDGELWNGESRKGGWDLIAGWGGRGCRSCRSCCRTGASRARRVPRRTSWSRRSLAPLLLPPIPPWTLKKSSAAVLMQQFPMLDA